MGFQNISDNFSLQRYIRPYHGGGAVATTSQTATIGRVQLHLIDVADDCYVDAIIVSNASTIAGSVTVGLYGPVSFTTDTCEGTPLKVESNSTLQSGQNTGQIITLTETFIGKGKYYIAIEFSDSTATYQRQGNTIQVIGWVQYYDRAGGYGALTNPCPVITDTGSAGVGCTLRISKQ